jgi:hypothetical protein
MANIVFTNNASALLAASIGTGDTSIQVAAGYGALFPSPTGSQYFYATLEDNAGNIEIVKCTGRSTDILTVVRGQEGTVGQAFTLNVSRVELRLTKATVEEFLQLSGGTLTGDVNFNTNNLVDAHINGSSTRITQGQIAGIPLRGAIDLTSNEIAVPDGGGRATVGAALILAQGDDIMAELDDAGVIVFDSATVGLQVPGGAYLRVEGPTPANHMQVIHDDTLLTFTFPNTTSVEWDTLLNMGANIDLQDNELIAPLFVDFAVKKQSVSGIAATVIDYTAGSYVTLTLTADITSMTINFPPSSEVGTLRLKIVQGASPWTITWPSGTEWPNNGSAPVITTTANGIDFVDLWTDDGGITWYGAYNTNWV